MNAFLGKLKGYPIFHLIVPLFPVFNLYLINWILVSTHDLMRPIYVILILSLMLFGLCHILLRDRHKSAFFSSLLLMTFFFFGYLNRFTGSKGINETWLHMALALLLLIVLLFVYKSKKNWQPVSSMLNWGSSLVLIFILGSFLYRLGSVPPPKQFVQTPLLQVVHDKSSPVIPDILYIVLDGYGRADILEDLYGYSNTVFIDKLKQNGFYVAEKSQSNYNQTILSLSSVFNMNYLSPPELYANSSDRRPLVRLINQNPMFSFLKSMGYQLTSYASGYGSAQSKLDRYISSFFYMTTVDTFIMGVTPLYLLANQWAFKSHALRVGETISGLMEHRITNQPQFVFAHIVCPHPPFLFQENRVVIPQKGLFFFDDGNRIVHDEATRKVYQKLYIAQLKYLNGRVSQLLDVVISRSKEAKRPLVIILQGDHGPGSMMHYESYEKTNKKERFSILNAYYFSDGQYDGLYPSISPVNSFRVVMNKYFQQNLPLLEDHSWFATWSKPFLYTEFLGQGQ